ncbi:MAG: tetratricopeptide repeat protein, partial [Acidobacteria bacterium]|nr:tetratricopeptide repeat protein [Acidobacteriota bacterium]
YNLGLALVGRGDLDGAIESFRRSLEIEPEAPRTHAMLAMALVRQGDRNEAVEHYRRALELATAAGDQHLVEQIRSRFGQ